MAVVDLPMKQIAIFHSYVSLPEGNSPVCWRWVKSFPEVKFDLHDGSPPFGKPLLCLDLACCRFERDAVGVAVMFVDWQPHPLVDMEVSWNRGTPQQSTSMVFSIVNHPVGIPPWLWKPPADDFPHANTFKRNSVSTVISWYIPINGTSPSSALILKLSCTRKYNDISYSSAAEPISKTFENQMSSHILGR